MKHIYDTMIAKYNDVTHQYERVDISTLDKAKLHAYAVTATRHSRFDDSCTEHYTVTVFTEDDFREDAEDYQNDFEERLLSVILDISQAYIFSSFTCMKLY